MAKFLDLSGVLFVYNKLKNYMYKLLDYQNGSYNELADYSIINVYVNNDLETIINGSDIYIYKNKNDIDNSNAFNSIMQKLDNKELFLINIIDKDSLYIDSSENEKYMSVLPVHVNSLHNIYFPYVVNRNNIKTEIHLKGSIKLEEDMIYISIYHPYISPLNTSEKVIDISKLPYLEIEYNEEFGAGEPTFEDPNILAVADNAAFTILTYLNNKMPFIIRSNNIGVYTSDSGYKVNEAYINKNGGLYDILFNGDGFSNLSRVEGETLYKLKISYHEHYWSQIGSLTLQIWFSEYIIENNDSIQSLTNDDIDDICTI